MVTSHHDVAQRQTATDNICERKVKTFDKFNFKRLHVGAVLYRHVGAILYRHEPEFFHRLSTRLIEIPLFLGNKTPIQRLKGGNPIYLVVFTLKGKVIPLQARCGPGGGKRYSSGQQHVPAALYPRERSGTHCTGGRVGPRVGLDGWKNLVPTGIRSRAVQPVVSRYTD